MQQDLLQTQNGDILLQEAWVAEVLFEAVRSGGKQILKLGSMVHICLFFLHDLTFKIETETYPELCSHLV